MESERERLIQAGATPDGEINNTPSGDKLCFLRDPWQVTVQLVQRLFVHANAQGASRMFEELVDSAAPTYAIAALGFFRQFYPDLEPGTRTSDQFTLADENRLIEVRIDPKMAPEERELGPGDPHVYYLILRQGRVSAIFELVYFSAQDPGVVTVLGERLINRIPSELAESQP